MTITRKLEWPIFFVLFGFLIWMLQPSSNHTHAFKGDDLRYISYAVALHEHATFGLSSQNLEIPPEPGNANAPLYPALIASVMLLDDDFEKSVKCVLENVGKDVCKQNFQSFFLIQVLLSVVCLFMIYYISFYFSQSKIMGWLAALLALGSGVFTEFSYIFMTEALILPVFAGLILACLMLYQENKLILVFTVAALLAVLTLIRPSYLYLFYAFSLFFVIKAFWKRDRASILKTLILILGFALVVAPWSLRNKAQFDTYTLTSGGYAEAILIQRANYNQMTWQEIGAAMVYWLPDFGDSVARKIFPSEFYNKLGWGKGSYYAQGYKNQVQELSDEFGGQDKILKHLVKEELLTHKHIAVSIPLAMRGTFIAKYWGLIGFIAFVALLIQTTMRKDYRVLIMSLPLFFMVAFHAGLSVSIPRYNLPLVTLYALSVAWYINFYGARFVKKFQHK